MWLTWLTYGSAAEVLLVGVWRVAYLRWVAWHIPDGSVSDYVSPGFGFAVLMFCLPGLGGWALALLLALGGRLVGQWRIALLVPGFALIPLMAWMGTM